MPNPYGNINRCQHEGCKNLAGKDGMCKRHRLPKCRIERCNERVAKVRGGLSELCKIHLNGVEYDLFRRNFDTLPNDPVKGWHQPFEESDTFGIQRRKI